MTYATIRSAAEHIARTGKITPHQLAALTAHDESLTELQRQGFTELWRAAGSPATQQSDLAAALKIIKEFEGCHLDAYPDPLSGGAPWTIGYGTTRYSDGRNVAKGDKINAIEADMLLRQEVDRIAEKLRATVQFWVAMADHQKCALISFAYNLGSGFYGAQGFETISKRLREKDWPAVPAALLLYRNPGSSVEAGLKRRREAEGRLWGGTQPQQQQLVKLSPSSHFSRHITPHITIGEFALNQEARRFNHQFQVDTAAELAAFLERVRVAFGSKPVIITSGYRSAIINRSVGGASGSEHLYNAPSVGAVDFYVQGADINAVQAWCDKEWPCSVGYGAPKGFVHLGIRGAARPRVRWTY
jgi:GH24 family phage-related lysozyme (muramidase)